VRRSLLVFVVLAVGLGAYLFIVELPQERAARQRWESEARLFTFEPADVDTIEFRRQNSRVVLARNERGWRLIVPLNEPALGYAVQAQLRQLSQSKVVRVLSDSVSTDDWSFYGLADYERGLRDIRVTLRDGSVQWIHVGNETPDGGFAYARPGGTDRLVMTERNVHQLSWGGVSGLREIDLFDVEDSLITRITVFGSHGSWSAARDHEGLWWRGDTDSGVMLSRQRMRAIAFDISSGTVQAYEGRPAPEAWRAYGLEPPLASIEWSVEGGSRGKLEIGNDAGAQGVFARRDRNEDLIRVSDQLLLDSETLLDSLVDHSPLRWNSDRADSVAVRWSDGPRFTLVRSGRAWKVRAAGSQAIVGDESLELAAKNLIYTLENLQSDQHWLLPVGDSIDGVLDKVPIRLWIYRGTERVRDLRLGWRGRGNYHWLALSARNDLYRVDRSLYLGLRGLGLLSGQLQP
jgi:Domain of unknown function (DUF4340)